MPLPQLEWRTDGLQKVYYKPSSDIYNTTPIRDPHYWDRVQSDKREAGKTELIGGLEDYSFIATWSASHFPKWASNQWWVFVALAFLTAPCPPPLWYGLVELTSLSTSCSSARCVTQNQGQQRSFPLTTTMVHTWACDNPGQGQLAQCFPSNYLGERTSLLLNWTRTECWTSLWRLLWGERLKSA